MVLVFSAKLGHLGMHLVHVQALDRFHDLLQGRSRQGAGLVEDQHTLTEGHQRRNALDAKLAG